ncbi:MAG TPA: hypothetical protein VLM36_06150 [Sphingomicrobium sp.]|nr:hypothetical protein [Sphingomicrobium sp.]
MTRVLLAAGVAALAIAAPANAGPHGGGGGHGGQPAFMAGGGGGQQRAQAFERRGGGGGFAAPRMQRQSFAAPRMERRAFAGPRMERQQRFAAAERPQRAERMQMRAERQQARPQRMERAQARVAERQQMRANHVHAQNRLAERQQMRANHTLQVQNRLAERQRSRENHMQQMQTRMAQQQLRTDRRQQFGAQVAQRQQLRANGALSNNVNGRIAANNGVGYGVGGCPPGLASKGCVPPGIARQDTLQTLRAADAGAFQASRLQMLAPSTRIIAPNLAASYVGAPLSTVANYVPLSALPSSYSYLYPDTPNYYYQYGGGYLYQVDRSTSLIDALIPLLAGGYMPGTYLPSAYMNSYVPSYYGLNSFYPASFDQGFGYGNVCNRYAYGVVYQVDCVTGMVENVVPTYAGGYGVGQMLPSAYSYYNVPMQYRSLYYPTADSSYWYAPGAIYQYDTGSNLITSVAALMSPGFTVGQPLPMGYSMYNVPMDYRATYYDTPTAWYRYNNGYIYQVDPSTMLVTSVVASLLG